jgi:hypothetical protein
LGRGAHLSWIRCCNLRGWKWGHASICLYNLFRTSLLGIYYKLSSSYSVQEIFFPFY